MSVAEGDLGATTDREGRPGGEVERDSTKPAVPMSSGFRSSMESTGDIVRFSLRLLSEVPTTIRHYPAETTRQMGELLRSNALVLLLMLFMLGAMLGITGTFLLESLGLNSYSASLPAIAIMRGVGEIVFGWILAAKYGCGIVAELGAMRISEEIDAMEVMGVPSVPFLLSTRVVASIVTLPALFVTGLGASFIASKLFFVDALNAVSSGGFYSLLFLFQGPRDLIISIVWATLTGVVVTLVACYYGYHAHGGPVGVGRATAQAMLVNLVLISLIAMAMSQLFYANNGGAPFGT